MHISEAIDAAVRVIPDSSVDVSRWWRHMNLRKLNLLLIIPLMSLFTVVSASWRIPSALQAAPALVQLFGSNFVPKSPRWLISKDRMDEGLAILAKYHAEGDANDALVQFDVQNYLEFVRTRGNRKRLFILFWTACMAQMSRNAFVSNYLAPILTTVGLKSSLQQTLINATQQMFSWVAALYFATLPAKVGRRPLFIASGLAMFICLVCITARSAVFARDSSNKAAAGAVVAFLYLFSPAYNLGLNSNLALYAAEIMPYSLHIAIIFDGEGSPSSQVSKAVDTEWGGMVEVVENVGQEKR
ncbi:hypothetical protein CEP52_015956 [Fusarium oligoseptatum]|uniref:Uncharacterized protein n=1 Tax=Fusarium oligoseptatum TaxID=2604345 RepID=A0A428S8K4_9HYPO|nr:hypothetical protein CEP52_015956 [Fusarium oligoseptatum]